MIFECNGSGAMICFKNTGHKILTSAWYSAKNTDPKEDRLRAVREVAAIILEDIRSVFYRTDVYPPTDAFLENLDDYIPESLRILHEETILKFKRGDIDKWRKRVTFKWHSIINDCRPCSFSSPLLIGMGAFLKKNLDPENS